MPEFRSNSGRRRRASTAWAFSRSRPSTPSLAVNTAETLQVAELFPVDAPTLLDAAEAYLAGMDAEDGAG